MVKWRDVRLMMLFLLLMLALLVIAVVPTVNFVVPSFQFFGTPQPTPSPAVGAAQSIPAPVANPVLVIPKNPPSPFAPQG